MSMSLWLEKGFANIKIKCNKPELNHCWKLITQNPDVGRKQPFACGELDYSIEECCPKSVTLQTKNVKSLNHFLMDLKELQSKFVANIDLVVIDENILKTENYDLTRFFGERDIFQCKTLVIRGVSDKFDEDKSDAIIQLLAKVTVKDCLYIQIPVQMGQACMKLSKIPHVSMKVLPHDGLYMNGGENTHFHIDEGNTGILNSNLQSLTIGESARITTLRITFKKFRFRSTDRILRNLTHVNKKGKEEFHDMPMEKQLELLSTDGLDIRRIDGALITLFVQNNPKNPDEKTFIIHIEYPWNDPLSERMPGILEAQAKHYQEYEELLTKGKKTLSVENTHTAWLEDIVDKLGEICKNDELEEKRQVRGISSAGIIKETVIELEKYNLERKLDHGTLLSSVLCGAPKRKEFGFLSFFFNIYHKT